MTHHTAGANATAVVAAHTACPAAANPTNHSTPPALRPAMVAIRNNPSTWRLPITGAAFSPSMEDLLEPACAPRGLPTAAEGHRRPAVRHHHLARAEHRNAAEAAGDTHAQL